MLPVPPITSMSIMSSSVSLVLSFLFFFFGSSGGFKRDSSSDLLMSKMNEYAHGHHKIFYWYCIIISLYLYTYWAFCRFLLQIWRPLLKSWLSVWQSSYWVAADIELCAEEWSADQRLPEHHIYPVSSGFLVASSSSFPTTAHDLTSPEEPLPQNTAL